MNFKCILFDVIGTTVKEKNPTAIVDCFAKAFQDNKVPIDKGVIIQNRGRDKKEMIAEVLRSRNISSDLNESIYESFRNNFSLNLNSFEINEGASELIHFLKAKGVKIGLGTGMEKDLLEMILQKFHWEGVFDFVSSGSDVVHHRPHPEMVFKMMNKFKITDPSAFMKVGDTITDIQEGRNAKVKTCALLSGTQPNEMLVKESPDFVVHSLTELHHRLMTDYE